MYLEIETTFSIQPQKQNVSKLNKDEHCNESRGSINGRELLN